MLSAGGSSPAYSVQKGLHLARGEGGVGGTRSSHFPTRPERVHVESRWSMSLTVSDGLSHLHWPCFHHRPDLSLSRIFKNTI